MSRYRLFYLRDNLLVGAEDIEAADDQAAVRAAEAQGRGQRVEIWDGHKRVNVVAQGSAAGAASARLSPLG